MNCPICGKDIARAPDQPSPPAVCPHCNGALDVQVVGPPPSGMDAREAYNVATDLVTGPNLRGKDNLYQAIAIVVCTFLGAGVGFAVGRDPGYLCFGAFAGVLAGLFGSGIFLMIYRAVRHARGRHD